MEKECEGEFYPLDTSAHKFYLLMFIGAYNTYDNIIGTWNILLPQES